MEVEPQRSEKPQERFSIFELDSIDSTKPEQLATLKGGTVVLIEKLDDVEALSTLLYDTRSLVRRNNLSRISSKGIPTPPMAVPLIVVLGDKETVGGEYVTKVETAGAVFLGFSEWERVKAEYENMTSDKNITTVLLGRKRGDYNG